jgi:hypothetical protein
VAGPTKLAEWAGLFRALSDSTRNESASLASAYRDLRKDAENPGAIGDGHLLGTGATSNFLRRLASRGPKAVRRAKPDRMDRPTFGVRTPLRDRVARPWTSIEAILPKAASPVSLLDTAEVTRTASVAFTDAIAPGIAMNLALSEVFVEDRSPVLVVEHEALGKAVERALAPLIEKDLAKVRIGSVNDAVEAGRDEKAERVVGVTSEANLTKLEGVRGEMVSGFATDVPSTFAIAPFPYDRSELVRMARLASAELLAPPCGTEGVEIVASRTWIQRPLFIDLLKDAVKQASARVRVVRTDGPPLDEDEPGIVFVEVDSDYVGDYFDLASKHIESAEGRWLVTAFAHPMELERPSFESDLEAFLAGLSATTLGINARASLLYLDGALPVGRRGKTIQNALALRGVDRALIESPLRWSACEVGAWGEARARYEESPSLGRAVGLAGRAFFA